MRDGVRIPEKKPSQHKSAASIQEVSHHQHSQLPQILYQHSQHHQLEAPEVKHQ